MTFYLPDSAIGQPTGTGSATVKFAGTAQATLSAPTTGTYKGVLFYQDRTADPNLENKFTGGTDMTVTGALYFPNNEVEFDGNNNTTAGLWTSVIARQMEFEGNSFFSPGNPPGIYPGGLGSARLVK